MKAPCIITLLLAAAGFWLSGYSSQPLGGVWLVEYKVGLDGMPEDIKIVVTADPALDQKVIDAVTKNWKSPKDQVGRRVRQAFPYLNQWPDEPYWAHDAVLVTVEFTIDAAGHTKGSKVEKSDDRSTDASVLRAVAEWEFPADFAGQHWHQSFYLKRKGKDPNA